MDVNAKSKDEWTVLDIVAQKSNPALFKTLVEGGLDVNTKDNLGRTVLHSAVWGGTDEMYDWLIEHGAKESDQ